MYIAELYPQNANITEKDDCFRNRLFGCYEPKRYTDKLKSIRNNHINMSVDEYSDTAIQNIENSMKEEIQTLKESREAYFGVLNSAQ